MSFPDPGVWMTFQVLTQEAESYVIIQKLGVWYFYV